MKLKKRQEKISIRDNYSRGELAEEILRGLAMGGLIVASFVLPNLPQVFSFFGVKSARDRYRLRRAIESLKKQRLVEIYEKDDEEIMEITERGKKKVLRYKFNEMVLTRPKKWDGLWRFIAFDIPERFKKERNALTRKLKEMEIYPIQKSVFVCPFECRDEIDFVGEVLNVRKHIHYFIAKEIDTRDEDYLKKYYNL